jgi:hypothetical protein
VCIYVRACIYMYACFHVLTVDLDLGENTEKETQCTGRLIFFVVVL